MICSRGKVLHSRGIDRLTCHLRHHGLELLVAQGSSHICIHDQRALQLIEIEVAEDATLSQQHVALLLELQRVHLCTNSAAR